ncbi:hypothetical protein EK21DRAFT_100414 [Setomelanomma holmii]|uniref:Zn(2)-C6 fungal-type domain-containing protein n=1 Tax=Setomelanomma holmii TaxID=210430 RepID=A0A9P4HCG7_9PLEO|nr:hypothetical protein EK21DRAFT_100414 [Setomelanomma holmii]
MMEISSRVSIKKTRRHHVKSRAGCFECKRRRVKCDEAKPACTRCVLCLDNPNTSSKAVAGLSETDLYHHYLDHTSLALSLSRAGCILLRNSIPALAQHNSTVLILLAGYRCYNRASERMRKAIALLLVPFATSSQQINHWMSKQKGGGMVPRKRLESTPRDAVVIMRGVRALLQVLEYDVLSDGPEDNLMQSTPKFACSAPSRTHFMTGIVATTSDVAFSRLCHRLNTALKDQGFDPDLVACRAAFDILENIRCSVFSPEYSPIIPTTSSQSRTSESEQSGQTQTARLAPQLHSFAQKAFALDLTTPNQTEPLTRFLLSFLICVPQSYLDLVLSLLDQRLETPGQSFSPSLTRAQALALDVYAYWLIFMFLVEEENWWIGPLSEVTLEGMMNRYGESSSNEGRENGGKWWPASMLGIVKDIGRFK